LHHSKADAQRARRHAARGLAHGARHPPRYRHRYSHRAVLRDHDAPRIRLRVGGRLRHRGHVDVRHGASEDRTYGHARGDPRSHGARVGRPVCSDRYGGAGLKRSVIVYFVLLPGTLLIDLAGPADAVRLANRYQRNVRFVSKFIGPAPSVSTSVGLTLADLGPLPDVIPDDAMIVVCGTVTEMSAPKTRQSVATWLRC